MKPKENDKLLLAKSTRQNKNLTLQKACKIFKEKVDYSMKKDDKGFRIISQASSKTINKQGDGFTHTIWVFSRATKKPAPGRGPHSGAAIHSLKQQRVLQLIWTDKFCQPT